MLSNMSPSPSKRSVSFPLWQASNEDNESTTSRELPFEETDLDIIHGDPNDGYVIAYGVKRYALDKTDVVALFGSDCNFDGLVVMVNKEASLVRDNLGDIRTRGCVTVCLYEKIAAAAAAHDSTMVGKTSKPSVGKRKRPASKKR